VLDLAAAYFETQQHVADLVRDLPNAELATMVPASPAWSVKDVVAHVTGVAVDAAAGRIPPDVDLVLSLSDPEHAARREVLTAAGRGAPRRDHRPDPRRVDEQPRRAPADDPRRATVPPASTVR